MEPLDRIGDFGRGVESFTPRVGALARLIGLRRLMSLPEAWQGKSEERAPKKNARRGLASAGVARKWEGERRVRPLPADPPGPVDQGAFA